MKVSLYHKSNMKFCRWQKFSHITQWQDFVKIKFYNYHGYKPRFLKLCKYQQNLVILMHNTKLMQSELFYCFYTHLCIFRVIKSVFFLNKQIFQLFQFIRAILRLLNHAKRLNFKIQRSYI